MTEPVERYSEVQQLYFRTIPSERKAVIDIIKQEYPLNKENHAWLNIIILSS